MQSYYYVLTYDLLSAVAQPPNVTARGPTSVMLSWEALLYYEVSFQRSPAAGSPDRQTQCRNVAHEGTIDVSTATEYTLDDLEEDSMYTITVTAVYAGESVSNEEVITTQQAGRIKYYLNILLAGLTFL